MPAGGGREKQGVGLLTAQHRRMGRWQTWRHGSILHHIRHRPFTPNTLTRSHAFAGKPGDMGASCTISGTGPSHPTHRQEAMPLLANLATWEPLALYQAQALHTQHIDKKPCLCRQTWRHGSLVHYIRHRQITPNTPTRSRAFARSAEHPTQQSKASSQRDAHGAALHGVRPSQRALPIIMRPSVGLQWRLLRPSCAPTTAPPSCMRLQ